MRWLCADSDVHRKELPDLNSLYPDATVKVSKSGLKSLIEKYTKFDSKKLDELEVVTVGSILDSMANVTLDEYIKCSYYNGTSFEYSNRKISPGWQSST